jgi:ATP-binding cassette subfamily B protein
MTAALADPDWGPLAILDATTRMLHAIVRAGGLRRGRQAAGVFEAFCERAQQDGPAATQTIPEAYWTVRPAPPGPDGEACLLIRGAVLVRVHG